MEMKALLVNFFIILTMVCCTNTSELETGEIKTFQLLKQAFAKPNQTKIFIDARTVLSREQVDAANIPVLFVELKSGQNGTLTPYPDKELDKLGWEQTVRQLQQVTGF